VPGLATSIEQVDTTEAAASDWPTSDPALAAAAAVTLWPATIYERAAARYGVSAATLRALHNVESGAASDGCLANAEGSGATGPLQFKPSTFGVYGVDADGDGRTDICGAVDSLFAAAHYLHDLGADADASSATTRRALERYGTDVEGVVALATWWETGT
jgi:membrane-bound lytic murein transglycosylase B